MTDAEIYSAICHKRPKAQSAVAPLLLLVASAGAYAAVSASRVSLGFAGLLVLALFIHETGHLIAMRLCRYKNVKMLFIPFLGAVTAGEPDDNDAFKIALIAAAGPLLGLVVGGLALGGGFLLHQRMVFEFGFLSLLLNAFNLLPIVPLDGGHILSELIFARHPLAEAIFKVVAAAALVALAVRFYSWVLVAIAAGILMALNISYRMARATVRLRTMDGVGGGELTETKVALIRQELTRAVPEYARPKYDSKLPGLISSLWFRINKKFPSRGATTGLLAGYAVVALALGALAAGYQAVIRPRIEATTLGKQATVALHRGDNATAKRDLTQALALEPDNPQLRVGRAVAEFEQRDFAAALADLKRAQGQGSPSYGVLLVRGRIRADQGQFSAAVDDLAGAAKLRPDRAAVYKFLGYAETKLGRLEPARRDLDRAVALAPSDGLSVWYRGYAEDLAGAFKPAAADYAAALRLLPHAVYLHYRLALVLRRQDASDGGAALGQAVSEEKDPWIHAIGEYLTGRSSDAELLARAADQQAAVDAWHRCQALYYIGMAHLLRSDLPAARRGFEASVATGCRTVGEYNLAQAELQRLQLAQTASSHAAL